MSSLTKPRLFMDILYGYKKRNREGERESHGYRIKQRRRRREGERGWGNRERT